MKSLYFLAALIILVLTPLVVSQDTIRLKTGATMDGVIVEQDDRSVTLEFSGGTMQLLRSQIAEIKQSAAPEDVAIRRSLMTLSRFAEQDSFHFLYRDGYRCGYRVISLKREDKDGLPGYAMKDRLVFLQNGGSLPDLDMMVTEFVDAELNPVHFRRQVTSGPDSRLVEGTREGRSMRILESAAGRSEERTALMRDDVQFPRMLLRRLASEAPPEGAYPSFRVFRPDDVTFGDLRLARRMERLHLRGREKDVLVFERHIGKERLETWVDTSGQVVREEIGSTNLVSLVAPEAEVMAWARGESGSERENLGLEFVSEPTGLRFLRPDLTWDLQPGQGAVLCSLFRAGFRATVDVYRLPHVDGDATEEGVALEVMARVKRGSEQVVVEQLRPETVGSLPGVQFLLKGMRRGEVVKTLGVVMLAEGQAFTFLCAAPEAQFTSALPGFVELIESVRVLAPTEKEQNDPWSLAAESTKEG
jgi:hypothetical protein